MYNYNSSVVLKCLNGKLPCIYGIYAVEREIKKLDKQLLCSLCNSKFPMTQKCMCYNIFCNDCSEKNNTNNIEQVYNNKEQINYLNFMPNEIILLIIDKLCDFDILNFCFATQKCDLITLKKLAYLAEIYCWRCMCVKQKYYNCFLCNIYVCCECTQKCAFCNNNVLKFTNNNNIKKICNDDCCHLDTYINSNIEMPYVYAERCPNEWSSCGESHQYTEYWHNSIIDKNEYSWSFYCNDCKIQTCINCLEYVTPPFKCKQCYKEQNKL